ncbi:MAG: aminopeptidase [Candidatus Micrarchaeota archaeon]|nr:aminopeptidase [Candidatus Micrarchaeota archaeon]
MLSKVAERIIGTNLSVREGEMVIINCGPNSLEFAEELAYHSSIIGAQPTIVYSSDRLALRVFRKIDEKYLRVIPKLTEYLSKKADVKIIIDDSDPEIEKKIPQKKLEIRRSALKPVRRREDRRIMKKDVKIALVGFPTPSQAKALGISFKKLSSIFWKTMNVNYRRLHEYNRKVSSLFPENSTVRITGKKTDLVFRVRRPLLDSGLWEEEELGFLNLPAGEVFFAPYETSAEGEIYFDLPCLWHYGKKVKGVRFVFKKGKVVEYEIEKGLSDFEDVIKNASGEKLRIAEFGIGTNPSAEFTGGMIIVDEKMRGTIHIAIGNNLGYGGRNESTIHWDFFRTMKNSRVYVNDELVMKNGRPIC